MVTFCDAKGFETGQVYSIRYRFTAADGKDYVGKSGWGRHTEQVGSEVTVLYCRKEPSLSFITSDFYFYEVA